MPARWFQVSFTGAFGVESYVLADHACTVQEAIGELVQIPCTERNAFGANKAVAAASLALRGDSVLFVTLNEVIETMRQAGHDMQAKYKETSLGGLAVDVAAC